MRDPKPSAAVARRLLYACLREVLRFAVFVFVVWLLFGCTTYTFMVRT